MCIHILGVALRNSATAFRFSSGFTLFGVYTIQNHYIAVYAYLISTPLPFIPIVNSIEELANSETAKTLLVKGSSTDEYFMV